MIISLINHSTSLSDEEVQCVIRAINRQVKEDFEPYWSFGATLRLEGMIGKRADIKSLSGMRGDAVLYLNDKTNIKDALGYHDKNNRGIPYGFIFLDLCKKLGESWTVTLSHETMELIADAQSNLLVQGPHPDNPEHEVFHWFEMCDAVQSESYKIDGIEVSNFVLPSYFTPGEQAGARNDFLGRLDADRKGLASFGVKPGGYIGFYDPKKREHTTWSPPEDAVAKQRLIAKAEARSGRGYLRRNAIA